MRVLEKDADAPQALAGAAPAVEKDRCGGRGVSEHLVDEGGSVVLEALDVIDSRWQRSAR